jgi:hypothetical protein
MGAMGGRSAPALQDESSRKNLDQLVQWIKDPAPPVPDLSPLLTDAGVKAVARYVSN